MRLPKGKYLLEDAGKGKYRLKSMESNHTDTPYITTDVRKYNRGFAIFSNESESVEWTIALAGNEEFPRHEGSQVLWCSPIKGAKVGTKDYHRIPVITTANNGDLLDITDLRYNGLMRRT